MSDEGGHPSDQKLDRRIAVWPAPPPPARFADRVLAARAAEARRRRVEEERAFAPALRRRRVLAGAGVLLLALAAGVAVFAAMWHGPALTPTAGSRAAPGRESITLGTRGVAVAEAGAQLGWSIDAAGAARIDQTRGDVFYRVERGGPFTVTTPAGTVSVTGTCLRVEVDTMKPSKQSLKGAAVGAAVTALAMVTVYEGRVLLANGHGSVALGAGARGVMSSGAAPQRLEEAAGGTPGTAAAASRTELLARDRAQQAEIARLRAQLARREGGDQGNGPPRAVDEDSYPRYVDLGKDELVAMARNCELRTDAPPIFGIEPHLADDRAPLKLQGGGEVRHGPRFESAAEREAFNQTLREMHAAFIAEVRKLYVEVTGDAAGAASLSPRAMGQEITDKSPKGAEAEVRRRIAAERAGLAAPPTNLAALPAVERYWRLLSGLGDEFERRLGEKIGPRRAHELRGPRGWPNKTMAVGCPSGREEEDATAPPKP